jgi:hypothetical protein
MRLSVRHVLPVCASVILITARVGVAATDLTSCAGIDDGNARLACYDKLAGRTAIAASANAISSHNQLGQTATATVSSAHSSAADAAQQPANDHKDTVASFGLVAKPLPPSETLESIESKVVKIHPQGFGHVLVTLENGQHWMIVDNDDRVSVGSEVTINRGALGSFNLKTKDRHSYRVNRVD